MLLHNLYTKLGPKMGTFGRYTMPMTFSKYKIKDVVINTRKPGYCSVFDVSHMGILETKTMDNINNILPLNLSNNRSKLTVMLDNNGKVLDDVIIGNINDEKYRLVVNANNKDLYKLNNEIIERNKIILAIQGDYSQELLENIFSINLNETYFMDNKTIFKDSIEICRCGYTGEDGFEIYMDPLIGQDIYKRIIELSETNQNILFGGLIERDLLRLEAGLCLSGIEFGQDMDVKFDALGMNFLLDKKFRNQESFKSDYIRVGFTNSRPIKKGNIYTIYDDLVGFITSSNKSYNIDEFIAIGYIKKSAMNHQLVNNLKVTNLPFIKTNYYKKL